MKETFPKSSVMIMADMVGYADGGVVSKQVLKNDAGNITLFSFDEGQGLSEHTAPFDALVQNLEGEVEIVLAGQPLRLKRGESVIMPAGVKHSLRAVTLSEPSFFVSGSFRIRKRAALFWRFGSDENGE